MNCHTGKKTSPHLLPQGASSPLAGISLQCLSLSDTLSKNSGVVVSSILLSLSITALERNAVTLVLEALGRNKTLDFWCLGVWLLALTLWLDFTTNDEFSNIIFLGETKELSDLGSALRTQSLWVHNICNSWDILVSLLDNAQGKN